jgi:hypothetical protein
MGVVYVGFEVRKWYTNQSSKKCDKKVTSFNLDTRQGCQ